MELFDLGVDLGKRLKARTTDSPNVSGRPVWSHHCPSKAYGQNGKDPVANYLQPLPLLSNTGERNSKSLWTLVNKTYASLGMRALGSWRSSTNTPVRLDGIEQPETGTCDRELRPLCSSIESQPETKILL